MRDLEKAVGGEATKVEGMVRLGKEEGLFDRMHALLLKYEMAGPDKEYYRKEGRELLAKQDRQAIIMVEYHELNRVSLEEPAPDDAGLAALAPEADEMSQ